MLKPRTGNAEEHAKNFRGMLMAQLVIVRAFLACFPIVNASVHILGLGLCGRREASTSNSRNVGRGRRPPYLRREARNERLDQHVRTHALRVGHQEDAGGGGEGEG